MLLLLPVFPSSRYNQVNAISLACRTGLEECQNLTKTWFNQWMDTKKNKWVYISQCVTYYLSTVTMSLYYVLSATISLSSMVYWTFNMSSCFRIHPNLRSTVYCNAIAAGDAKEWEFAWKEFLNTTIASEAEKLRSALACTNQPWLLNRSAHRQPC